MSYREVQFTFRPLPNWPYPDSRSRRSWRAFSASWLNTLSLLRQEILMIGPGTGAIIAGTWRPEDIRNDGLPRADAKAPAHPGVEISFDIERAFVPSAVNGRLVYATDVCEDWKHNVRSIALGLAALRAVDRYGITRRGEQYAGFAALPAGGPDADRGRRLVEEAGGIVEALRRHHPDQGGQDRDFIDVQAYREQMKRRGAA